MSVSHMWSMLQSGVHYGSVPGQWGYVWHRFLALSSSGEQWTLQEVSAPIQETETPESSAGFSSSDETNQMQPAHLQSCWQVDVIFGQRSASCFPLFQS